MSGRSKKYNLCWHKPTMHSLKRVHRGPGALSRSFRCHQSLCHGHTVRVTSSPQHPNTRAILRAHAEHSVGRKFGSFKRNEFWPSEDLHGKSSCASGVHPTFVSKNKLKMPLILIPCQDYSSLHTPDFSGLQEIKVISICTCRDGLCRGPLRPRSPIALGGAQTPPKPEKSSQPCETPHKHPPDNLDVGNKILQYLCGHLSPAIF